MSQGKAADSDMAAWRESRSAWRRSGVVMGLMLRRVGGGDKRY